MRILALTFLAVTAISAIAQDSLMPVDPPQLVARRAEHIRAMKRAEIAPLTAYVRSLTSLRQQFLREGNSDAVAAVDAEIKTTQEQLVEANAATNITAAAPVQLVINQALYGDFQSKRTVDVSAYIQNAFASETPTVSIRGTDMAGANDPAPGVVKSLKVIYTFNGRRKEKTFKTGSDAVLDFKRDLK